jgi:hypothetical protein
LRSGVAGAAGQGDLPFDNPLIPLALSRRRLSVVSLIAGRYPSPHAAAARGLPLQKGGGAMKRSLRILAVPCALLMVSGCAYQAGYNPTYIPDEEPEYISADEVLLVMPDEVEDFVYSGSPATFTGSATTLTIPLGTILKQVSEEILEDRFSGRIGFANAFVADNDYRLALAPTITRFEYRYSQLKNLGFAITPEVELDLAVKVLDGAGETIFQQQYESGRVSGDTYVLSGSPSEKINQTIHRTLYDLLEKSFADARPAVLAALGLPADARLASSPTD